MASTNDSTSTAVVLPDTPAPQCDPTTVVLNRLSPPLNREEADALHEMLRFTGMFDVGTLGDLAATGPRSPLSDEWCIELSRHNVRWIFDALRELDVEAESYSVTVTPELIRLVEERCMYAADNPEEVSAEERNMAEAILGKLWGCDGPLPKIELRPAERLVLREAAESWVWGASTDQQGAFEGKHRLDPEGQRDFERSLSAIDALGWERDGAAARAPRTLRATPPIVEMLRGERDGTDEDVVEATCRVILRRFEEAEAA